jgi:hypothetical protein
MHTTVDTLSSIGTPLRDGELEQATGGAVALAVVIIVTVWYLVNVYQP